MTLKATGLSGATGASAPTHGHPAAARIPQPARSRAGRAAARAYPRSRPRSAASRQAIAALMIAPDVFQTPAGVYLGLRAAQARLAQARGDADLVAVADLLWAMAVQIEDGDASQAQRDLRAAEEKLREALKRGASDAEIRELTKELRARRGALHARPRRAGPGDGARRSSRWRRRTSKACSTASRTPHATARARTPRRCSTSCKTCSRTCAARATPRPTRRCARCASSSSELEKLLRDQQALRDETFRRDQRERMRREARPRAARRRRRARARSPDQPSLEERQRALRERLAEMQRRLKSLGMKGEKGFDDAQGDMKEAEGDLKGDGQGQSAQGEGGPGPSTATRAGWARPARAGRSTRRAARCRPSGRARRACNSRCRAAAAAAASWRRGRRPGDMQRGRDPLGRERGRRARRAGRLAQRRRRRRRARAPRPGGTAPPPRPIPTGRARNATISRRLLKRD